MRSELTSPRNGGGVGGALAGSTGAGALPTFTVESNKTLKLTVPAQRARILVPQDQVVR